MNTFIYILKTSRGVAASLQYHIMYLDDISRYLPKTIRDLDGNNKKNIRKVYRNGILDRTMCHTDK